ncbi:MAG: helix-turn-helix domain-containing protein [Bacteroidales bacterium]|nr:helix-turn-helix domain-containing protein [Bacteroidales bacterium]
MITRYTFHEGKLTIAINGHVDSSMAMMLQEEMNAAIEKHRSKTTELVLDAEGMSHISSLGLRCILQLKKEWPEVQVVNCCADVYNVFKMTGFTRIITVTKSLPRFSSEILEPVEGLEGVYHLSDETMVKVFPRATELQAVEREVKSSRELFIRGVPTVMTFEVVRVDDCYGLVFESVEKKAMDAATLGELMKRFHQHIIEPNEQIPSAIETEKQKVRDKAAEYGEERTAKMFQVLNTIPDGSALVHGNFSMQKVAFSERGAKPVITDLGSICFGNPVLDMTSLYNSLPETQRTEYFDELLRAYYNNESEASVEKIRQNIVTLAKAYRCFEEGVTDCWDEIFSDLHFKMDFAERIRQLERQRFYLNGDVNIDWVASHLATNRHYVSDYFNKVLHVTFSDYINNLRLEYAVSLIRSGRVLQQDIASSAGFNSDHTFRRLFKQKYGCTPSQFK